MAQQKRDPLGLGFELGNGELPARTEARSSGTVGALATLAPVRGRLLDVNAPSTGAPDAGEHF